MVDFEAVVATDMTTWFREAMDFEETYHLSNLPQNRWVLSISSCHSRFNASPDIKGIESASLICTNVNLYPANHNVDFEAGVNKDMATWMREAMDFEEIYHLSNLPQNRWVLSFPGCHSKVKASLDIGRDLQAAMQW